MLSPSNSTVSSANVLKHTQLSCSPRVKAYRTLGSHHCSSPPSVQLCVDGFLKRSTRTLLRPFPLPYFLFMCKTRPAPQGILHRKPKRYLGKVIVWRSSDFNDSLVNFEDPDAMHVKSHPPIFNWGALRSWSVDIVTPCGEGLLCMVELVPGNETSGILKPVVPPPISVSF